MRRPADDLPPIATDAPRMSLSGGLLIPLLGLGMLHGVMSAFDALFV